MNAKHGDSVVKKKTVGINTAGDALKMVYYKVTIIRFAPFIGK